MSLPSHHKTFIWNKTDGLKDLIGYSEEGNLDGKPSTLRNVSANWHMYWIRQSCLRGWL